MTRKTQGDLYDYDEDSCSANNPNPLREEKSKVRNARANLDDAGKSKLIPSKFGICSTCKHATYRESKYGWDVAWCTFHYNRFTRIDPRDPPAKCTEYYPTNVLDINDMWRIAILIDPSSKIKAGFTMGDLDDDL